MAVQRQFFDVWLVESDTVYREVPFTVVCDWVQQGRLLDEDQVRSSGTADWKRLADIAAFAAFLPKPEPLRAEDQAEALEPVTMEFHRKKKHVEEDDDADRDLEDGVLVDLLRDLKNPKLLPHWGSIAKVFNGVTERR